MGLFSRFFHVSDVKADIKLVSKLPEEILPHICHGILTSVQDMTLQLDIDVYEVVDIENFNVVTHRAWSELPFVIGTKIRPDYERLMKKGNDQAAIMYLGTSYWLHSIRAMLDWELNTNKNLTMHCQKLWSFVSTVEPELVPKRFR